LSFHFRYKEIIKNICNVGVSDEAATFDFYIVLMKTLMIQGISSNTGKSIFVTGLCRMLFHRGVKVCPFKPQNISLNSYITDSGDEIGYAQYIQAYASGIKAERYMNPVLIKISDKETQFVLNGEVRYIGNFSDYKKCFQRYRKL